MPTSTTNRKREERIELRATSEEKALFERAAAEANKSVTGFMLASGTEAARRILADRSVFVLDEDQLAAWEDINSRPVRELPGLRKLMERPSPFTDTPPNR